MQITPPKLPAFFSKPLVIAVTLGVTCALIGLLMSFPLHSDERKKSTQPDRPMVVNQGNTQFVPADSPLRKRLLVAAVGSGAAQHPVDLPGVVEADPATTINILPPLTGR